jgi:hypothetical protein
VRVATFHQAVRMDRGQPLGQPGAQRAHPVRRQRPVPADRLLQRRAVDVGGDHPRRIGERVGVDHRGGVEAPDPAGGLDLAGEALTEVLGPGVHRVDQLDRDRRPLGETPRNTWPIPPAPSLPSSW